MPYQPDPALVRECARRIIHSEIDTIRDLGAADISEMCEDEIAPLHEVSPGSRAADDATDALIAAVREDIKAAVISHAWPEATPEPFVHFTIRGLCGVCGADTRSAPGPLTLAWDEADDTIDCPPCRMYLKGLRAGRGDAR